MADHLKVKYPFTERPRSDWGSIATELLGAETKFIKGEKWTHRVVEKGDPKAPPLFMYHGIGGHVEPYARTLPQLAKHFRVFAVDALYHGYSSKEPWEGENRVVRQAEAYVDLINACGYDKAHYEGESMGAFIGFEIGMRFPETVDKLILNGFGIVETKQTEFKKQPYKGDLFDLSKKAVLDPSYENVRNRLLWLVHDDAAVNDEMIAIRQRLYQDPAVNAAMRRVFGIDGGRLQANHDAPYTEEQIKAQWTHKNAMVIYGEFNPGRGPDYGEYCADLIGAKFYEFKGAGHWPMWETPDEYLAVLRSFLES